MRRARTEWERRKARRGIAARRTSMGKKVAVILGGRSAEREISLRTGHQVGLALRRKGHDVFELDLDDRLVPSLERNRPDVAFIALHGRYGEDGCLQGLLEIMGIPYVGSGVLASALAMNKLMAKRLFGLEGLTCPRGVGVTRRDLAREGLEAIGRRAGDLYGYPLIVKPNKQGSTIGLTLVKEPDAFAGAIERAFGYDDEVVIEEYVKGTEVTVAVLGNTELRALPIIEIVPATGLYDYEAKYTKGMSEHIIPARISSVACELAREIALRAHAALGCRGVSRSDMIIGPGDRPYLLEVNTIPGMTETSLVPDAARAAGIDFPELVDMLVALALER